MSETEPPETPSKAARVLIGWFAGALAFKAVEKWDPPQISAAIEYGLGAIIVAIIDYKLSWLLSKTPRATVTLNRVASDARWWVAIGLVSLLMVTLSPFIEQRRWPFTDQIAAFRKSVVETNYKTDVALTALTQHIVALNGQIVDLENQNSKLKKQLEDADQQIADGKEQIESVKNACKSQADARSGFNSRIQGMLDEQSRMLNEQKAEINRLQQQCGNAK